MDTITKLKTWYVNSSNRCNPIELEQATVRIFVGVVIFLFSLYSYSSHKLSSDEYVVFEINLIFELLAFGLFYLVIQNKLRPVLRRIVGAWLDIGTATIFMSLTGDIGVALIIIYLWVVFGNGFRYGKKYLYHAQILSVIGFLFTLNSSPYWKGHEAVGYSLLAMLIILPLYVAQLITRLNEAKKRAEEASKRAEEANHAKTRFVANMSHEIRTPLNGIIGISTLFKSTPLNADQQDLLKTLESSSKLLLSILNNVLDFTKIEEHKLSIEQTPFSVEETVHDTIEIFRAQAQAKGVKINASISDSIGLLKGDAVVLRQILANLMGNAVKFTEQGNVIISATLLHSDDMRSTVRFSMEDSGVGIPADKLGKIFDSFTQADASTTRKFGGSGLGLTIAKHMVEALGGELNVQSTEGVGSRFWFDLTMPKEIAQEAAPGPIAAVEPISKVRGTAIAKPLNVLICEDESTNQKILTRLLELPGHRVNVASSADEMLDKLEHHTFDLVITDLNMADMSGTEAIKIYRFTRPEDKSTRFILFTADATLAARQEASDAGFDAFLTKPVDAATLFNTIEKILNLAPNTATMWMNAALNNNPVDIKTDLAPDNVSLDVDTLTALERIGANDQLFMHRLLKNYLADALQLIYKIEAAAKDRQYGDLQDYCHALKGNSLSVGALQLAHTMEDLGKISSSVSQTQIMDMVKRMNTEFSDLTMAVEDYLRRPEAASQSH